MRPLFSVRHSPRLTNRKGVLTRMAPPQHGYRHAPPTQVHLALSSRYEDRSFLLLARLESAEPAIQRLGREDDHGRRFPANTSTVASGRSSRRCNNPLLAPIAIIRSRFLVG